MNLFAIFGIFAILAGLLNIFGRNFIWKQTKWEHDLEGVQSQRTSAWDTSQIVGGIFAIVVGVGILIFSMSFH